MVISSQLYNAIGPAIRSFGRVGCQRLGFLPLEAVQGLLVKFQKTSWAKSSPMIFQPQGLLFRLSMMLTPPLVRLFW